MLPDLQFAEDFKQLRRDIEEIKNAQRIGRDIMRPKIVECLDGSGNPTLYDLVTTLNEWGDGTSTDFTAKFIAQNQAEPWGSLFIKAYYGNPNTPVTAGQMSGFFYLSQGVTGRDSIGYKGSVTTQFMDTTLLYLKFFMYATDNGILEVSSQRVE